ncbi:MAG TPA: DNA polymerase III subunit gamma/tau, partial [Acidobacteriota bacterium]|nr:DNA polymerase III subunit gamma/tau [Acidobacteriota bacterium]
MDVLEIDAASNRGIEEIRELKENARYNPARDRSKIFIIDEVHMLTPEAFNALLKILEEPPPHVVFILATTEYHKIPATILSRCQQYSFKLIQYPLILERLREIAAAEAIDISDSSLEQVVFSSGGSMRDAMSALDQVIAFSGNQVREEDVSALLGMVEPKVLRQTVKAIAGNDLPALLKIVADCVEAGRDLTNFCRRLSAQFRNLMIINAGVDDPALIGVPESLIPELREQAALFSREDLLRIFDAFQKIETGMRYAAQVRFHLEMGLIELAHLARLRPLEELVAEFSSFSGDESAAALIPAPAQILPAVHQGGQKIKQDAVGPDSVKTSPAVRAARSSPRTEPKRPDSAVSETAKKIKTEESAVSSADDRALLEKIGAATGREAVESLLQAFEGARLQADSVVLSPGTAGAFICGQVKDNLKTVAEAASGVVGRAVTVVIGEGAPRSAAAVLPETRKMQAAHDGFSDDGLMDKAKREPVVRSFLDMFPGPATAEKMES